jgi:hypothetical protein
VLKAPAPWTVVEMWPEVLQIAAVRAVIGGLSHVKKE